MLGLPAARASRAVVEVLLLLADPAHAVLRLGVLEIALGLAVPRRSIDWMSLSLIMIRFQVRRKPRDQTKQTQDKDQHADNDGQRVFVLDLIKYKQGAFPKDIIP